MKYNYYLQQAGRTQGIKWDKYIEILDYADTYKFNKKKYLKKLQFIRRKDSIIMCL